MLPGDIEKALKEYCTRLINRVAPRTYLGTWIAAESVDANLSQVNVGGDVLRYVPKNSNVTLTAGDQVFLLKGFGTPAIILCKVAGDITKAQL